MKISKIIAATLIFLSVNSFGSETVAGAKKDFNKFKTEMNEQLEKVEKQISEIKNNAKEKGNATQDELASELEKTRLKLKKELSEASDNGKSNWSKFKTNFADSVDNLNNKIKKAVKD